MNQIQIPWRVQLGFVAASYGAVLAFAAAAITSRYLAGLRNPNDFNGGMAAFGDWMLDLLIAGLLLVPTFFLALVIRKREALYIAFAKVLFVLSLTGPLGLGLLLIPAIGENDTIMGDLCMYRVFATPMIMTWFAAGRLLARFKAAKRLTTWALVIEVATMVLFVVLIFFSDRIRG